jgi:signal transduction histidine kinase
VLAQFFQLFTGIIINDHLLSFLSFIFPMTRESFIYIFFFYGLAFFCMGLAVLLETHRSTEERLRFALPALAAFGFLHGFHEWYEMFEIIGMLPYQQEAELVWETFRIILLSLSFISLAIFGAWMFSSNRSSRRLALLFPLGLVALWGLGVLIFSANYVQQDLADVADVWTRYTLGITAALAASAGLVFQQREMRRQGMKSFGRDCLWAAIAFFWYGLIGQTFTRASALAPSTFWNSNLFIELFGFPIQLLRAIIAIITAIFIIHFLRLFEVETQRRIISLQEARLEEAQSRETMRGEMLRRIVAAQEAERQRIARELHDATGQSLTALGLGLRSVSAQLHHDSGKAESNLQHLETMVANSLDELQRLIADLRPSHLDDLGLPAAIRWYSGEIQRRFPLRVIVTTEGNCEAMATELNIAIFRIIQEALTNVIKHANAQEVNVKLEFASNLIKVRVEDDGSGFEPDSISSTERPSWGILGMRERTNLLGGTFYLFSRPGWGTRVEVEIPCNETKETGDEHSNLVGG